jgi:hypothetical protein
MPWEGRICAVAWQVEATFRNVVRDLPERDNRISGIDCAPTPWGDEPARRNCGFGVAMICGP